MNLLQIQTGESVFAVPELIHTILLVLMFLVLVYLVYRTSRNVGRMPSHQLPDHTNTQKRLNTYDRIAGMLHDMLSFFSYTGNWEEISPHEIIKVKRELDKELALYGPLFSDQLVEKCQSFIQLCFISASGWEHDIKIKSLYELRQEHQMGWDEEWIRYFDTKNVAEAVLLKEKFHELIREFNQQLNLS